MYKSIGLWVQEKKRKIDFQDGHHGGHLRFWIRTILAIFDLQVTPMLPTRFRVNWPFSSGKIDFQDGHYGSYLAIAAILDFRSEQFQLLLIYKLPWCFLPSFKSTGLLVQEEKWKMDFQDGHHGGHHGSHLGFPIETILAIFYLQVTPMLPSVLSQLA